MTSIKHSEEIISPFSLSILNSWYNIYHSNLNCATNKKFIMSWNNRFDPILLHFLFLDVNRDTMHTYIIFSSIRMQQQITIFGFFSETHYQSCAKKMFLLPDNLLYKNHKIIRNIHMPDSTDAIPSYLIIMKYLCNRRPRICSFYRLNKYTSWKMMYCLFLL